MEELDPKNIFVIRQRLALLKKAPKQNHYEYYVEKFKLNIWTTKIQEPFHADEKSLLEYDKVDVDLFEIANRDNQLYDWIYLDRDSRFIDYEPIQYPYCLDRYQRRTSGRDMPLPQVCELIKYLYRLSNLTAFL